MHQWVGKLPLFMRDMDLLPGLQGRKYLDELSASSSKGDKFDPLAVQLGKMVVGGKLGIKDQGGLKSPARSFPEGKKLQDLVVGLIPLNVRAVYRINREAASWATRVRAPFIRRPRAPAQCSWSTDSSP